MASITNILGTDNPKDSRTVINTNFSNLNTDKAETSALTSGLATKQATLVSGTNIKTINSNSILGSGDLTISTTVADGSITTTKLGGDITTAGKALLDDADAAAQRATLGLGTLATQSGTFSGTSSGTNTGDQTSIVGITGTMAQFDTAVTDGNIVYQSQALGTPASGTLTNCTGLPVAGITASTSTALGVGSIELGHATDTTISRSSAGVIAVEGVVVPTVSSTSTLTNKTLTKPTLNGFVNALTADTDGATITFDMASSNIHTVTLAGNRTLAVSNVSVGQCFILRLQQDATGSRTVTWFTTLKWAGGSAPTLTTTASKADLIGFLCTSAGNYDAFVIAQNI